MYSVCVCMRACACMCVCVCVCVRVRVWVCGCVGGWVGRLVGVSIVSMVCRCRRMWEEGVFPHQLTVYWM